jgi:hypothetical protein
MLAAVNQVNGSGSALRFLPGPGSEKKQNKKNTKKTKQKNNADPQHWGNVLVIEKTVNTTGMDVLEFANHRKKNYFEPDSVSHNELYVLNFPKN